MLGFSSYIIETSWISTGASVQLTAPPCGVFLTSPSSYCQTVTNCTKQVLTNQSKRMFALLTFCKRLHCKRNRQRWGGELWPAGCVPDRWDFKKDFHCLPLTWCGWHKKLILSQIVILTSFVLQWCFSLTHQHLEENKKKLAKNATTAVFLFDVPLRRNTL